MPDSPEELVPRRKRVAKACETCRVMKSKCDGKRPSCGRCKGYGYRCAYSETSRRTYQLKSSTEQSPNRHNGTSDCTATGTLRDAIAQYENLVRDIVPKLPGSDSSDALNKLFTVKQRVEDAFSKLRLSNTVPMQIRGPQMSQPPAPIYSQRYLGDVSDIRFFNLVKRALEEKNPLEGFDEGMDSYEQDDPFSDSPSTPNCPIELPSPEAADEYLEIYFSTIHTAYPFIPRRTFMKTYINLRDSRTVEGIDYSWLATLYITFALGAYYTSFHGREANALHEQYFQHALALSKLENKERSVSHVSFLLVECFYLLAVCRTDSCWITLGLAVRLAQSIGLHVAIEDPKTLRGEALLKSEMRRRVWYSLYVLDRLLSLQLGRPPAIHDDDCCLPLPLRLGDVEIDWESEETQAMAPDGPSTGDYFLSVIALSRVIGSVLRDQYSSRRGRRAVDGLLSTSSLDKQLLEWKGSLPRTLRFDLGHAFETSITFKRQRNMLAIKFHHLRAVIHRPYLCLPLLQHIDEASMTVLQGSHIIDRYEKICICEAQATAHLLHNVINKRDLVHDFPWWQMISCIICASSILLVASVFMRDVGLSDGDLDVAILSDDAETCLKVFEALSANSNGARIARDMMTKLREQGHKWRDSREHSSLQNQLQLVDDTQVQLRHISAQVMPQHYDASTIAPPAPSSECAAFSAQDWPAEIVDSMVWSAQFFDAVHDSPTSTS